MSQPQPSPEWRWSMISRTDSPAVKELQELEALVGRPEDSVLRWVRVNSGFVKVRVYTRCCL